MLIGIEHERQVMVRVILRRQIPVLFRTIRSPAVTRVVNPPDDVIEVRLLPHLRQVRSEVSADALAVLLNRVTGHASALMKQFAAVSGVTSLLLRNLAVKTLLPKISRNCLDLIRAVLIALQAPERWHLRSRPESLRVLQPDGNPVRVKLQSNLFQIRPNLLLILKKVTRVKIQLVNARCYLTIRYVQRFYLRFQFLRSRIVRLRPAAYVFGFERLAVVGLLLLFQLTYKLSRAAQSVRLSIKAFVAMA